MLSVSRLVGNISSCGSERRSIPVKKLSGQTSRPSVQTSNSSPGELERSGDWFARIRQDASAIGQLVSHQVINTLERQWEKLSDPWYPDLEQQPAARVGRPVILVPGWSTETEVFAPLLNKLGQRNPAAVYVKNGQFFSDPDCQESTCPTKETKVYMLVFQDNRATPDRFLAEFQLALSSLSHSGPVDVMGYSLGGSVARDYLDRGGDKIGKLLMLGTPANGSPLVGASVHILRRDIKWASSLAGLKGTDLDALEALAPNSAYFKRLDSRLEEQLSRTEATELAGVGNMWTLSDKGLPWLHGDGLVPLDSLKLPGVPINRLDGEPAALHEHQPYSVGAYQTMTRFFGWEISPPLTT